MLLVVDGVYNDGEGGEDHVVELVDPGVVDEGAREVVDESVPELGQDKKQVFEEIEEDQLRVFPIALPSVVQHQFPQDLKL